MEREEELEQTIDELNYRLTNALKKIDRLKSNIKQTREKIEKIQLQGVNTGVIMQKDVLAILDKLIAESENK